MWVPKLIKEKGGLPINSTMPVSERKALGAYYTDEVVTRFLAAWAIRSPSDTVLEPSFGGGAFLKAAAIRLAELGGSPYAQIFGCELDAATHATTCNELVAALKLNPANLTQGDFFDLVPGENRFSIVIGNPPFVRYQLFSGPARQRALRRAAEVGVQLSELCSSWAPFLVHATRFLMQNGRLAMVMPLELLHAAYARPVLRYLHQSFSIVTLLTFDRRLFPSLSQDTLLVLAEGYGHGPGRVLMTRLASAATLTGVTTLDELPYDEVDIDSLEGGSTRAALYRVSPRVRSVYQRLAGDPRVVRLGQLADVGIGYVTGANDWFHLSAAEAEQLNLPWEDQLPAIRRGRDLAHAGLTFTWDDWRLLDSTGGKYRLFYPTGELTEAAARYVASGEKAQVHTAYKCRSRSPWWKVPWVTRPDLILTVMSGSGPRLVANRAGVVVTNTLHVVRLRVPLPADLVAAAAVTSLSLLSAEIEGHALGGGMLKLEPSEASQILLPVSPSSGVDPIILDQMDKFLRAGDLTRAVELGDRVFLEEYLGLAPEEIGLLRRALHELRAWRRGR